MFIFCTSLLFDPNLLADKMSIKRRMNYDTRIRNVDWGVDPVDPTRTLHKIKVRFSQQVKEVESGHVLGENRLKK